MHRLMFHILVVLTEGTVDGVAILERLRETDPEVSPSLPTFYRCLRAGLAAGWIQSAGTLEQSGTGRPRQTFALTTEGKAAVEREARDLLDRARLVLREDELGGSR